VIYINNEMPLYIHQVRALLLTRVHELLSCQPKDTKEMEIDLFHTLMDVKCREILLDVMAEIFFYFDEYGRSEKKIDFPSYRNYVHRQFVFFKDDITTIKHMDRDLVIAVSDLFITLLRLLRLLFNIEFKLSVAVAPATGEGVFGATTDTFQQVLSKILDALNEMYYNGRTQYLAHLGDMNIVHRRGAERGRCMHNGYLLAHHSLAPEGVLYDESIVDMTEATDTVTFLVDCHDDIDQIPIILDNSAFELGSSAHQDDLIDWYKKLGEHYGYFSNNNLYEYVLVMPDKLGDHVSTLRESTSMMQRIYKEDKDHTLFSAKSTTSFMVVLQDTVPVKTDKISTQGVIKNRISNLKELITHWICLSYLYGEHSDIKKQGAARLWVGMPMMRYDENHNMVFDKQGGELRAAVINEIGANIHEIKEEACAKAISLLEVDGYNVTIRPQNITIHLHILGCISPVEYKFLDTYGKSIVRSLDTSFPFSTATIAEDAYVNGVYATGCEEGEPVPTRPWHIGRKVRLHDEKPFSMTALSTLITDKLLNSEGDFDSIHEQSPDVNRVDAVRYANYQLDMWRMRLKHMSINQRMFEEWVADIWQDNPM